TGNETDILAQVTSGAHRRPREVNPSVQEALDECCSRALRPDPAERYATAADFAEATEKAAAASGVAVASLRAVAAFVTALGAPERPVSLRSSRASLASSPGPVSSRRQPMEPSETELSMPETLPGSQPSDVSRRPNAPAAEPAPLPVATPLPTPTPERST